MEYVLQTFFGAVPQATAIWLIILLALGIAVAAAALPRGIRAPRIPDDENRFAATLEAAAIEAAEAAGRRRTEWAAAQDAVDGAWDAYEEASDAARRTGSATAFPLMSRRRRPGENVDRQRYLHRAATELCRSQNLSIAQLNDVYAHRGWNPRLHPVQQEAELRNAVREHRFAAYRKAVEKERAAWRGAEAAAETLRGLRTEAATARLRGPEAETTDQQWWAEQWAPAELSAAA
ncbi:hypothetical protein [Actinoplanes derwentensis]|uniref:Uncharacterized protein n=1 Tax=Actinoplanes derwentensis TaxID=113562 RepID=A0A1H2DA77_9ACTN|nr:hypothetical protein [Actinoplanes derwentensis]GID81494.1 hypothetical protein Ade03nite_04180 [Actinoplanes derwentensis]SDT79156.1 hypothetical protein SAMN04489716_8669 [Actinoplanes derwentensis]